MKYNPHPVAQTLRKIRESQNINQQDLAEKIGVSRAAVAHWERGYKTPTWFNFICWTDSLGVEVVVKEKTNALD